MLNIYDEQWYRKQNLRLNQGSVYREFESSGFNNAINSFPIFSKASLMKNIYNNYNCFMVFSCKACFSTSRADVLQQ